MSRFDRADPSLDPDYCDDLSPEPFDEDRAELAERPICPNCQQWQHPDGSGGFDCFHDCVKRGFAPRNDLPADEAIDLGDIATYCPPAPSLSAMPGYGLAVLHYLMSADLYLFGMVDDHGLQCADHSALIAVASVDITEIALNKISAVRIEIATVLSRRAFERRAEPGQALSAPPVISSPSADNGDGGARKPAPPLPIAPSPSTRIETLVDEMVNF